MLLFVIEDKNKAKFYSNNKRPDMVFMSEKVQVSPPPPPKASTKPGVKSINLTMGLENTNLVDILRKNPHQKILEWLGNKNLGKYQNPLPDFFQK